MKHSKITRLKLYRLEQGVTMQELADRIGVARTTLQCYETRRRDITVNNTAAKQIANALGMTVDELAEDADPPEHYKRVHRTGKRSYDKVTLLKKLRLNMKKTQHELAMDIGISKAQLQGFENQRYDIESSRGASASLIAHFFGKSQEELGTIVDAPAGYNTNLSMHKRIWWLDTPAGGKIKSSNCKTCNDPVRLHRTCKICEVLIHDPDVEHTCFCGKQHGIDNGNGLCVICHERAEELMARMNM